MTKKRIKAGKCKQCNIKLPTGGYPPRKYCSMLCMRKFKSPIRGWYSRGVKKYPALYKKVFHSLWTIDELIGWLETSHFRKTDKDVESTIRVLKYLKTYLDGVGTIHNQEWYELIGGISGFYYISKPEPEIILKPKKKK